jgi:hypothetical protein
MATIQEKMGHLESGSAHPLQMHLHGACSFNNLWILPYRPTLFFVIALTSVTLHSMPGITRLCFPGIECMVVALKPRNPVLKPRTKFRLKFVRDLNAKTNLSHFLAAVLFRDLSTKHIADSGIYVQHRDPPGHIPGIECSVTSPEGSWLMFSCRST